MLQKQTLTVHFIVWGYWSKDTLSSEEKLGPRDPHVAKSPQ